MEKPEDQRQVVLLLGMHRSGTSIATRLLLGLGLHAPKGAPVPADEYNAGGYWESRDLTDFDDRLLRALGAPSHAPPAASALETHLDDLKPLKAEAVDLVCRSFQCPGTTVWKDPRLCILWPFWMEILGSQPVVLVHRDPVQVADSLRRRDRLPAAYSIALWERYTRSALAAASRTSVHVESYADLLANVQGWASRVQSFLASVGIAPRGPAVDQAKLLRHPRALPVDEMEHARLLTPQQRDLMAFLQRISGATNAYDPDAIPPESPSTTVLVDQARNLWSSESALRASESRLARSEVSLTASTQELQEERAQVAKLEGQLQDQVLGAEALQQRVEAAESERDSMRAQLDAVRSELAAMRSSSSWKITTPARQLADFVRAYRR